MVNLCLNCMWSIEDKIDSIEKRDGYAKALKDTEDKEERRDLLAHMKSTPEYIRAHSEKSIESKYKLREQDLSKMVNEAENLDDLKRLLGEKDILSRNNDDGLDHSEHLIKRIEMAEAMDYSEVLPEMSGFKDKVKEFIPQISDQFDLDKYKEFIRSRMGEYSLSEEEINFASYKLPAETFATIDKDLEKAVVMLNSMKGTRTTHCCAGHDESPQKNNDLFINYKSDDKNLTPFMEELKESELKIRLERYNDGSEATVRLNNSVPDEWIKENNKKSHEEIFNESRQKLAEILGDEILDCNRSNINHKIYDLQQKYVSSSKKIGRITYPENSTFIKEIVDNHPTTLEKEEYKEYYSSDEFKSKKKKFIDLVTKRIDEYRKNN